MRTFSIFRALAVAAVLSAPLAQAAFAGQQMQQAAIQASAATLTGGAYGNDTVTSPAVGD
ncbi:MAG: hypothetical protein KGL11_09685 [Alphaproteobacteria bacterium]|nr:hypothetical protein [Alphaproteobacteria bacterium]